MPVVNVTSTPDVAEYVAKLKTLAATIPTLPLSGQVMLTSAYYNMPEVRWLRSLPPDIRFSAPSEPWSKPWEKPLTNQAHAHQDKARIVRKMQNLQTARELGRIAQGLTSGS